MTVITLIIISKLVWLPDDLHRYHPYHFLLWQAICYICSFVFIPTGTVVLISLLADPLSHVDDIITGDLSFVLALSSFLASDSDLMDFLISIWCCTLIGKFIESVSHLWSTAFHNFPSQVLLSTGWSWLDMPLHHSYVVPLLHHLYFVASVIFALRSIAHYGPLCPWDPTFPLYCYSWSCKQEQDIFASIIIYITVCLTFHQYSIVIIIMIKVLAISLLQYLIMEDSLKYSFCSLLNNNITGLCNPGSMGVNCICNIARYTLVLVSFPLLCLLYDSNMA